MRTLIANPLIVIFLFVIPTIAQINESGRNHKGVIEFRIVEEEFHDGLEEKYRYWPDRKRKIYLRDKSEILTSDISSATALSSNRYLHLTVWLSSSGVKKLLEMARIKKVEKVAVLVDGEVITELNFKYMLQLEKKLYMMDLVAPGQAKSLASAVNNRYGTHPEKPPLWFYLYCLPLVMLFGTPVFDLILGVVFYFLLKKKRSNWSKAKCAAVAVITTIFLSGAIALFHLLL